MIKYALECGHGHQFEGWFSDSADFDQQQDAGLLTCPSCGAHDIEKALMAPAISTSRRREAAAKRFKEVKAAVEESAKRARDYVEKNFEHVGKNFPEEARKIHYGEADERAIYGDATPKEAKELSDEGIAIAQVPVTPEPPETAKKKLN